MTPRKYRRSAASAEAWRMGSPELTGRILEAAGISARVRDVNPVALASLRVAVQMAETLDRPVRLKPRRTMPLWLVAAFDRFNARHFRGRLPKVFLHVDPNDVGGYGAYLPPSAERPAIIFVTGAALAEGRAFARETLLHEMIHHCVSTVFGVTEETEHGPIFVHEANRIGAVYGWPRVMKPDGMAARMWPHARRTRARGAKLPAGRAVA